MKQIFQSLENGKTIIIQAPTPQVCPAHLLIQASLSLISSGTERMLLNFSQASYLQKARQQPEKVKMVLEKIKTDGLMSTIDSVRSKLAQPLPLGYCHVGVVSAVGPECDGFKVGDRVVSNGAHADVVRVPKNLCAKIPDVVDDDSAAFTVVASIALQGIRLTQTSLGEMVVVIGAGLIGLLAIQLLKAQGCRVLAVDLDVAKLRLAKRFGAEICNLAQGEDPIAAGMTLSRGHGADAVLITASTQSNDPVTQAARMSRKRGKIVLVGVAGLKLDRADFYEKELTFQVSCSYGPGRYDPNYEEKGQDYPIGLVRWTEQRHFEAILDMMASGRLDVKPLITHRFKFEQVEQAYDLLIEDKSALGIVLEYQSDFSKRCMREVQLKDLGSFKPTKPVLGFIGAGNYASRVLMPAFKKAGAQLHTVVTSGGVSGVIHGEKAGFARSSTDLDGFFNDGSMNTVVVATRHHSHATFVKRAIALGKHVFVEKTLALNLEELSSIEAAYHTACLSGKRVQLMVGFNRRFSPLIQKMKTLLQPVKAPKSFIMTMNAGAIPPDHWTQDKEIGGGRIIGEACHLIDLMRHLVDSEIISIQARCMGSHEGILVCDDKASITLGFADGSFGTIHYFANGAASFPKERVEVFAAGRILQMDNFRKLRGFGWPGFKKMSLWRQDKGQSRCVEAFLKVIEEGVDAPIPFDELIEVARVSIEVSDVLKRQ